MNSEIVPYNMAAMILAIAVGLPAILYTVYCLYMKSVKKWCTCTTDLTGKTVIVSGSDKGKCVQIVILISPKLT